MSFVVSAGEFDAASHVVSADGYTAESDVAYAVAYATASAIEFADASDTASEVTFAGVSDGVTAALLFGAQSASWAAIVARVSPNWLKIEAKRAISSGDFPLDMAHAMALIVATSSQDCILITSQYYMRKRGKGYVYV